MKVYKYLIQPDNTVTMERGAKIVLVGRQNGEFMVWAEYHGVRGLEDRHLHVFGTGHDIPAGYTHVGSFQDPPFVWHVYENKEPGQ